jgi:hypothetical protein
LQYLAIIEQRTNEILQMYEECQEKDSKAKGARKEDEAPMIAKPPPVEARDMGVLNQAIEGLLGSRPISSLPTL